MRKYEHKGPPVKAKGRLGHRCPKCRGYILIGGLRMGMYVDDIESCLSCGLSSESPGYVRFSLDRGVVNSEWVEMTK